MCQALGDAAQDLYVDSAASAQQTGPRADSVE